jgi:site-specific recombinase XerD
MCGRKKGSIKNSKPILEREYKILKSYINGLETFQTTKTKWIRSLELLYMSGMRVSEILDIKIKDIMDGIQKGELSVFVKKQNIIRHIPLSEKSVRILKKLIDGETDMDGYFIHKRNSVRNNLNPIGFTKDFNQLIQMVLGKNYSSHSFRKGIITEMGVNGINPKIIQHFVSHKNISTTLNYINPTSDDIRNCLIR